MIQTVAIGKCFVKNLNSAALATTNKKPPHHKKVTKFKYKNSREVKDTKQKQSNKTTI